jgi:hypothetical protein
MQTSDPPPPTVEPDAAAEAPQVSAEAASQAPGDVAPKPVRRVLGVKSPPETCGLLVIRELAKKLNLPLKWLEREVRDGRVPAIVIGRSYYGDAAAVAKAIQERGARYNLDGQYPTTRF